MSYRAILFAVFAGTLWATSGCGGGIGVAGEDDGATSDASGLDPDGAVVDGGDGSTSPVCGDGVIDGNEACDDSNLAGETCVSQGFDGGDLSCGADCAFDYSGREAAGTARLNRPRSVTGSWGDTIVPASPATLTAR